MRKNKGDPLDFGALWLELGIDQRDAAFQILAVKYSDRYFRSPGNWKTLQLLLRGISRLFAPGATIEIQAEVPDSGGVVVPDPDDCRPYAARDNMADSAQMLQKWMDWLGAGLRPATRFGVSFRYRQFGLPHGRVLTLVVADGQGRHDVEILFDQGMAFVKYYWNQRMPISDDRSILGKQYFGDIYFVRSGAV